jgi:uncharacterized protein (DUF58 family)
MRCIEAPAVTLAGLVLGVCVASYLPPVAAVAVAVLLLAFGFLAAALPMPTPPQERPW